MNRAYIRREEDVAGPQAGHALTTLPHIPQPVPPTAAEFLGWPSTRHPWLRLAFIHDALARNQTLPEEKRWRVTALDLAAALDVNQRTIVLDVKFMREDLGAPITFDDARYTYRYLEEMPLVFVDCLEMLRQRKEAGQQSPDSAPPEITTDKHYQRRKVKETAFERMEKLHALLLVKPMTGPELARATGSSVLMVNRDIAYMRLQLGIAITFRSELAAYALVK